MAFAIFCANQTPAFAENDAPELPEVAGVLGFMGFQGASYFAVRVDYAESAALAAMEWFSNDGLLTYPAILVGTGYPRSPGDIAEMIIIAEDVSGPSSAWTTLTFPEPIAASHGGVYVVFEFPEGVEFVGAGEGGGPGFGYCDAVVGARGWMSTDGEMWLHLHCESRFAVRPVLVSVEPGMLVKSLDGDPAGDLPVLHPYLFAGPNPFNPRTDLRFGLPRAVDVKLDLYDVRGRRVIRLIDGMMAAGRHEITWTGTDGSGRGVASGVYFVYMRFGKDVLTRKIMLVR